MRFDLTIRADSDIPAFAELLGKFGLRDVNITDTDRSRDQLVDAIRLRERMPEADIVLHVAVKHHVQASADATSSSLQKFFDRAAKEGIRKILLVSGYPRERYHVLDGLQLLQSMGNRFEETVCVYNPFFDPARLREEHERLERKLSYPFVTGICMQMGVDRHKLKKGIETIRSFRPDARILCSVAMPDAKTRKHLSEHPLYGVFLPQSFLQNDEIAAEATADILRLFRDEHVSPVVYMTELNAAGLEQILEIGRGI